MDASLRGAAFQELALTEGLIEKQLPVQPWLLAGSVRLAEVAGEPSIVWDALEGVELKKRMRKPGVARMDAGGLMQGKENDAGILDAFIKLENAPGDRVRQFAEDFGPLYICQHFTPILHRGGRAEDIERQIPGESALADLARTFLNPVGLAAEQSRGDEKCRLLRFEPLWVWQKYARDVRQISEVRAYVAAGRDVPPAVWDGIFGNSMTGAMTRATIGKGLSPRDQLLAWRDFARIWVVRQTEILLDITGVRLRLSWAPETPQAQVRLDGLGSLAAVARQLMRVVTQMKPMVQCSGCSRFFTPERRHRSEGKKAWCGDKTCKRKANRLYQRSRRAELARVASQGAGTGAIHGEKE